MPTNELTVRVSITRMKSFQRLVTFVMDCESLASINADDELQALVEECRDDLLGVTDDD